ncbi:MAG: SDR family oxidoreductase [Rhodospirillales bacterium]
MDLGIAGKKALVCAASKGLGKACAAALAREGCEVTIVSRSMENLEKAAANIKQQTGKTVTPVVADLSTDDGRAEAIKACGDPDILINNCGGPPPGYFREWDRADWIKALDMNMINPIMMIKATVDGMIERKFGRIVNITSASVKEPIKILGLSNGARAGLTGFCAGIARETITHNVTINNLLPGGFETERLRSSNKVRAERAGISLEDVVKERLADVPAGRFGDPAEFGDACAYLCSAQAGYVSGLNFLIDGGRYKGAS